MSVPRSQAASRTRRTVLAGTALLLALAVALPVGQLFIAQREDIRSEQVLLARFRAETAAHARLQAQLNSLRRQETVATEILHGDSTSLAAASMQGLVKTLVERHAGQLRSAQMLAATAANGLEKIVVQYEISIPLGSLKAVTYELETRTPFLFLDEVEIRPDTIAGGESAAPANLHVQWTVHGYRKAGMP